MKTSPGPAHGTGAGFSKDIGLQTGPIRQTKIGSAQKTHREGTKPVEIARLVAGFNKSMQEILLELNPSEKTEKNVLEMNDTVRVEKKLNSIALMLLTLHEKILAINKLYYRQAAHESNLSILNAHLFPKAIEILGEYLTYFPDLKRTRGTRPSAVIRKLRNKKYLALDVGKEMPDGKHYSRVFFGGTLEPVWMEVNPKTGNIVNDTMHTRWK